MPRISKGAEARATQAWRTWGAGWPAGKPWPLSNADCKAMFLPHQGEREKARRRHTAEMLRFEGNRVLRRLTAQFAIEVQFRRANPHLYPSL